MPVTKIISGGQTGADQGGLEAGLMLSIETGGTAPPRFMTEDGPRRELLEKCYRLREGQPDPTTYRKRTIKNVQDSDGTVWFGREASPGGRLTLGTCGKLGRPFITNPSVMELRWWIEANKIAVLNVAGNRESKNVGIQQRTREVVYNACRQLLEDHY